MTAMREPTSLLLLLLLLSYNAHASIGGMQH
jgi:hypothetical protein